MSPTSLIATCVTAPRRTLIFIVRSTDQAEAEIYLAILKLKNPITVCRWLRFLTWLSYPIYSLVRLAINYPAVR